MKEREGNRSSLNPHKRLEPRNNTICMLNYRILFFTFALNSTLEMRYSLCSIQYLQNTFAFNVDDEFAYWNSKDAKPKVDAVR